MRASPFSVLWTRSLTPRNKVRITREHASPRRFPPALSFFFSITPHLPGKIMPVHISPALSARQVALGPRHPRFLSHVARERRRRKGMDRCPESLPVDVSYADVAIWIETDSSNATVPFRPHRPPKPTSTLILPRSSQISPPSAIYLVKLAWNAHMLVNGRTHMPR